MEVLGLILVIIFALVSSADRKKKAAQRAQAAAQRRTAAAPRPVGQMSDEARRARQYEQQRQAARARQAASAPVMPSNAKSSFESSLAELKTLLNVAETAPAEGESMLIDTECRGGSMPHAHAEGRSALDDAECAGGSMPHAHTQGVSRAAQARRLAELDHDQEAGARGALIPDAIDARALRRAVVMAEVLGKPRALQRPGKVA